MGEPSDEKRPRKRKAKGPNPLSCLKKKKKDNVAVNGGSKDAVKLSTDNTEAGKSSQLSKKKRKKRKKIAEHVRQELELAARTAF